MLAYVYSFIDEDYKEVSVEEFDNPLDLIAVNLVPRINRLIKQGFFRDYIRKSETGSSIRGKINLIESFKTISSRKKQLNFTYNEYSINNYLNQIIKTTLFLLIKSDINDNTKNEIRRILLYFSDVDTLDARSIDWRIRYYRNNKDYEIILNICYLALNGFLQTDDDGALKLLNFSKKFMYNLYEKFIYKYYETEYEKILKVDGKNLHWPLEKDDDERHLLPKIEPDIVLSNEEKYKILVIDAKYYRKVFNRNGYLHSANLYQIFTYVKCKQFEYEAYDVRGMLLYAGTDEERQPMENYMMDGNMISVYTLNLNKEFQDIKDQLDKIAVDFFGEDILK